MINGIPHLPMQPVQSQFILVMLTQDYSGKLFPCKWNKETDILGWVSISGEYTQVSFLRISRNREEKWPTWDPIKLMGRIVSLFEDE